MPWMVEVANLRKGFGDPPRSISLKRIFRILLLWQLCPKFAAVALWVGAAIIGCLDLPLRNKGAIWLALVQAMRGKVQSFSKQPTQLQWSFHTLLYLNTFPHPFPLTGTGLRRWWMWLRESCNPDEELRRLEEGKVKIAGRGRLLQQMQNYTLWPSA